jgi:cellobiose phosphorylase
VRPEYEGLRVQPCLGPDIPQFTVTRQCRGATYRISVRNGGGTQIRLTVGGQPIEGTVIPYAPVGTEVTVECEISG